MKDDLNQLVQSARHSPDAFWPLVDALRLAISSDPLVLLTFARSPSKIERKAAAAACGGQTEPVLVQALLKLASDNEIEVRHELGYNLKNWPTWVEMDAAIEKLLTDADTNLRQNSAWAAQRRPALLPILLKRLHDEDDLWIRSEIAHVLGGWERAANALHFLQRRWTSADIA